MLYFDLVTGRGGVGQMQIIETMFEVLENCIIIFLLIKGKKGGSCRGEYQFFSLRGFIQTVLIYFLPNV